MEIWKATHVSDNYEVSNLGRVRSLDRYVKGRIDGYPALKKGRILKSAKSKVGYLRLRLRDIGLDKMISVHRLVCMAFVSNDDPANKTQINHKDGNKENNTPDNLEWCTVTENNRHARATGLNVARSGKESHSYGFNNNQSHKVRNVETNEILPIVEACKEYPFTRRHFTMMMKGERTNKTKYVLL